MNNTFRIDTDGDIHLNVLNNIMTNELALAIQKGLIFDLYFFYDSFHQFFVTDTWALDDTNCPADIDHIFYNQIKKIKEEIKNQFPSLKHIK
jgi:hypothetical protein